MKRAFCLIGLAFLLSSCTSIYHQKASSYEMGDDYQKVIRLDPQDETAVGLLFQESFSAVHMGAYV